MKVKQYGVAALLLLAMVACDKQGSHQAQAANPNPQVSHQAQQADIWLDVRTLEEYQEGHLKDAINIPFDDIKKISTITNDKKATIHLYCRSGRRAEVARQTLMDLGYTNVTNQGGYRELLDKGYQ